MPNNAKLCLTSCLKPRTKLYKYYWNYLKSQPSQFRLEIKVIKLWLIADLKRMANQVTAKVANLQVVKARTAGSMSWTTWLSLSCRGEQQNLNDLLSRWGKRREDPWAVPILRYNNDAERMEGFRWKLVDWNVEGQFKASRMWKDCKSDEVKYIYLYQKKLK